MLFKARIVTLFLLPAVTLYSLASSIIFKGVQAPFWNIQAIGTTTVMASLCALAQDLTPRSFKEVIVFWRLNDRLPGCRAFTLPANDRFSLNKISNLPVLATLPGAEQQRVFYRTYKKHSNDPVVSQYSFRYCAWRDVATLYLLLGVLTVPVALTIPVVLGTSTELKRAVALAAVSMIAYVLTALAARQSANSLVGQVLACETAGRPHAITI